MLKGKIGQTVSKIGGNAKVTAKSEGSAAGMGTGGEGEMSGTIIIGDNAFFVMRAAQFGFTPRIKLIINLRYTNVKLIVCL